MGVVYVKDDCVVRWSQGQTPLVKGDVWDIESPLVAERPELFSAEPTLIKGRPVEAGPMDTASVEKATAAPGEKRTTRRTTSRG